MPVDHRAQVEDLLADYRRGREQLASVHRALADLRASASTPDGAITATVGSGGTVIELEIADGTYRHYRPERLAAAIVDTIRAASAKAARAASDIVAPVLPPGTDPEALLRGTADLTPEELAPPAPVDDSFENRTWLESGGVMR